MSCSLYFWNITEGYYSIMLISYQGFLVNDVYLTEKADMKIVNDNKDFNDFATSSCSTLCLSLLFS